MLYAEYLGRWYRSSQAETDAEILAIVDNKQDPDYRDDEYHALSQKRNPPNFTMIANRLVYLEMRNNGPLSEIDIRKIVTRVEEATQPPTRRGRLCTKLSKVTAFRSADQRYAVERYLAGDTMAVISQATGRSQQSLSLTFHNLTKDLT